MSKYGTSNRTYTNGNRRYANATPNGTRRKRTTADLLNLIASLCASDDADVRSIGIEGLKHLRPHLKALGDTASVCELLESQQKRLHERREDARRIDAQESMERTFDNLESFISSRSKQI